MLLDDTYKEVRKEGLGRGHTQMTCAAAAIKALVKSVGRSGELSIAQIKQIWLDLCIFSSAHQTLRKPIILIETVPFG